MATYQPIDAVRFRAAVSDAVHSHRTLYLFEGILLLILGTLAILVPAIASLAATVFFGWLLLLSGLVGLVTTIRGRHAPGFWWSLLSAIVGIVAGVLLIGWPLQGTLSLTSVLIAFLLVEGALSIFYALEHRKALSTSWGWMLASGILDVALGAILFAGLPGTAMWALGLLLGINLIFGGWALIMLVLSAPSEAAGTPA